MTTVPDDLQEIIRAALAAVKRGDRETARRLVEQANALDPGSEKPWLMMAVLADPQSSVAYIRRALMINPQSQEAQQALAWALKREAARSAPEALAKPAAPISDRLARPAPSAYEVPVPNQFAEQPAAAGNTRPVKVSTSLSTPKWFSLSNRRWLPFALTGLTLIVVIVVLAVTQPQVSALFRASSANPGCVEPILVVGPATFSIRSADPAADVTPPAAPQDPGMALWVGGTGPNFVMLLNPSTQNQYALASLKPGAVIRIRWADCTQEFYAMRSLEVRPNFNLAQVDPSRGGITLVLFMDEGGQVMVVNGEVPPTAIP